MNSRNIFLVVALGLSFSLCAEVSFCAKDAEAEKGKVEKLVYSVHVRSKLATGALAIGGLVIVRYYCPGVFPNLPFWSNREVLAIPPVSQIPVGLSKDLEDLVTKIRDFKLQFTPEEVENIKQLIVLNAEKLKKETWLQYFWDGFKKTLPFLVAPSIFGYIENYRRSLVRACFPNISLTWFIGSQTRWPHFDILFGENIKLLQHEREEEKIASLAIISQDSLACLVQQAGKIVGYMYYRAQEAEKEDPFMATKLKNLANHAYQSLSLFCRDMNVLFASPESYIGIPGRFDSFNDEFDFDRNSFMICENGMVSPSIKKKIDKRKGIEPACERCISKVM